MGLDIGEINAKEFFYAFDSELLGDIDELAAAVITAIWITLCILIRHNRALGFQNGQRDKVFAGDQFDIFTLPLLF